MTISWYYTISSLHPEASYTGSYITSENVFCDSYESALEKGLSHALELI